MGKVIVESHEQLPLRFLFGNIVDQKLHIFLMSFIGTKKWFKIILFVVVYNLNLTFVDL